jgi:hypothetical protein
MNGLRRRSGANARERRAIYADPAEEGRAGLITPLTPVDADVKYAKSRFFVEFER